MRVQHQASPVPISLYHLFITLATRTLHWKGFVLTAVFVILCFMFKSLHSQAETFLFLTFCQKWTRKSGNPKAHWLQYFVPTCSDKHVFIHVQDFTGPASLRGLDRVQKPCAEKQPISLTAQPHFTASRKNCDIVA